MKLGNPYLYVKINEIICIRRSKRVCDGQISPGSWGRFDPEKMLDPFKEGEKLCSRCRSPVISRVSVFPSIINVASPSDTSFFVHTLPIRLFVQHDAKPSFHRWGCTGVVGNMKAIQITYYVIGV